MKPDYPMPDQMNRAFQLAFFVLADRELAIQVLSEAIERLQISSLLQQRRTYYKAINCRKVTWPDENLLELSAMLVADRYEKKQESECATQSCTLTREDLIIRYVKQIVLQAMSRSSFYATIVICRLLYSYTHSQTRAIYDWLVPDEVVFKDDSAFRRAKARLRSTLQDRFSAFLNSNINAPLVLRSESASNEIEIVERALAIFAPRTEGCPPDRLFDEFAFDAATIGLSNSRFRDDRIERTRIHIVICPSCFNKLNHSLHNPLPSEQLSMPQFCSPGERLPQSTANNNHHLPDLTFKDFNDILQ